MRQADIPHGLASVFISLVQPPAEEAETQQEGA